MDQLIRKLIDSRAVSPSQSSSDCTVSIITITHAGKKKSCTNIKQKYLTLCHAVPSHCLIVLRNIKSHIGSLFLFNNSHCISYIQPQSNRPAYLPPKKEHIYKLTNCVSFFKQLTTFRARYNMSKIFHYRYNLTF
jgi:hypothetical protein